MSCRFSFSLYFRHFFAVFIVILLFSVNMNINCRSFWHRPIICFAATSIWCVCALLHAQLISTPHAFTKRPLLLFNAKCSSMSVSRQGEQPSLQAHLTSHIQLDVLLLLSIVFFFFCLSFTCWESTRTGTYTQ